MTLSVFEQAFRDRIHRYGDALPVDVEADWQNVLDLAPAPISGSKVVAWPSLQPRRLRWRYRRPLVLAMVAAAIVAAATVGALTLGTGPAASTPALPEPLPFRHGSHDPAVTLLQQAADLQDRAQLASGGSIRYARTQNYALQTDIGQHASTTTVETTVRDVWVGVSGTGVAKTALQDTTRSGAPVGPVQTQTSDDHWQDTSTTLPTTLPLLRSALLGSGATGDETDLILAQAIMAHLGQGTTTPGQTASLYRLLAASPGVFDAGEVTDSNGRTGHAVGILTGHFDAGTSCTAVSGASSSVTAALASKRALGDGNTYLVLDPTTGQPLMVETVDTPNPPCALGLPAGSTIEQYTLILKAGRVDAIGAQLP